MAKRSYDGFTEIIFKREMGFSHPGSISRRISASEVLFFFFLLAYCFEYSSVVFVTPSCLFPFSDETFATQGRVNFASFFVYKLWVLDGYVISIRKSSHFLDS